jgi:ketosteroid isomerase-like protein
MFIRKLTLPVICLAIAVAAQTGGSSTEELRAAEKAWVSALQNKDLKALDQLLADDLVYTHSTGIVESKAQYIAMQKSGTQVYKAVDYEDMKIRRYGDAGVVTAKVRMRGSTKGTPFDNQLQILHVWAKKDGRWQLVAHQTTRLQ